LIRNRMIVPNLTQGKIDFGRMSDSILFLNLRNNSTFRYASKNENEKKHQTSESKMIGKLICEDIDSEN
jgi:hypothetical protein